MYGNNDTDYREDGERFLKIDNVYNTPIKIVSGEFGLLNNRFLKPGQVLTVSLESIPAGYKEYLFEYVGPNRQRSIYVGWISADVTDGTSGQLGGDFWIT